MTRQIVLAILVCFQTAAFGAGGVNPTRVLTASAESVAFPETSTNSTISQSIVLTNYSANSQVVFEPRMWNTDSNFQNWTASSNFVLAGGSCTEGEGRWPITLAPSATCTLNLSFRPAEARPYYGVAQVRSCSSGSLGCLEDNSPYIQINLQGMGVPAWQGTKQVGVAGKQSPAKSVTSDRIGNIIVAGHANGPISGSGPFGIYDLFVIKYGPAGNEKWRRQIGISGKTTSANSVTTDKENNIYVSGWTNGGLDGNVLSGTEDAFIVKYDLNGNRIWTRQLGVSAKHTFGNASATSSSGVFLVGHTNGNLDGNIRTGYDDFFVTKFDFSGNKLWTRQLGGHSAFQTFAKSVSTDSLGNIYIAGRTSAALDGNQHIGRLWDFFIAKYDPNGTKQWVRQSGMADKDWTAVGIACDPSGSFVVTGTISTPLYGNSYPYGYSVAKYDAFGVQQWLYVNAPTATPAAIASDGNGNYFITGTTTVALDGNTLMGRNDFFVTKFNSLGSKEWTRQLGAPGITLPDSTVVTAGFTYGYSVAIDPMGNIFIAGETQAGLDGNTAAGYITVGNASTRSFDMFVTKYNSNGEKQ